MFFSWYQDFSTLLIYLCDAIHIIGIRREIDKKLMFVRGALKRDDEFQKQKNHH
ncbi:hypothetical protein Sps_03597 [Shewanella psychrophila]|uniref:Uncharacterized protein n=1 Tax=Shewanella psychrophila TaxID=225848 RepID=A0A1S6HTB7_9GAMM|nr:hypothetical protein Sps_03597 [Shewanella psychrophila]